MSERWLTLGHRLGSADGTACLIAVRVPPGLNPNPLQTQNPHRQVTAGVNQLTAFQPPLVLDLGLDEPPTTSNQAGGTTRTQDKRQGVQFTYEDVHVGN